MHWVSQINDSRNKMNHPRPEINKNDFEINVKQKYKSNIIHC